MSFFQESYHHRLIANDIIGEEGLELRTYAELARGTPDGWIAFSPPYEVSFVFDADAAETLTNAVDACITEMQADWADEAPDEEELAYATRFQVAQDARASLLSMDDIRDGALNKLGPSEIHEVLIACSVSLTFKVRVCRLHEGIDHLMVLILDVMSPNDERWSAYFIRMPEGHVGFPAPREHGVDLEWTHSFLQEVPPVFCVVPVEARYAQEVYEMVRGYLHADLEAEPRSEGNDKLRLDLPHMIGGLFRQGEPSALRLLNAVCQLVGLAPSMYTMDEDTLLDFAAEALSSPD